MKFDLAIVGNGIFSKLFLFELNKIVNKSQNFSVATISNEKLFPACSYRTTSTVSLNGIESGVSPLGDELRNAFFSFEDFVMKNNPQGVWPIKQQIFGIGDDQKLKMRYGEKYFKRVHPLLKEARQGVELDSYIISPELLLNDLDKISRNYTYTHIEDSLTHLLKIDDYYELKLKEKNIQAKKIILCMGAYSRINAHLFENTLFKENILKSKVASGSYLKKSFEYPESFYLNLDGHNIIYRKETKELIIGNTTVQGAFFAADLQKLEEIFSLFKSNLKIDLGDFDQYEIITGLRHKGQQRRPSFGPITADLNVWHYHGSYKNGWSLPFYYIPKFIQNIFHTNQKCI